MAHPRLLRIHRRPGIRGRGLSTRNKGTCAATLATHTLAHGMRWRSAAMQGQQRLSTWVSEARSVRASKEEGAAQLE
eukprot:12412812-Alexandrium_andersonii.AAC.1